MRFLFIEHVPLNIRSPYPPLSGLPTLVTTCTRTLCSSSSLKHKNSTCQKTKSLHFRPNTSITDTLRYLYIYLSIYLSCMHVWLTFLISSDLNNLCNLQISTMSNKCVWVDIRLQIIDRLLIRLLIFFFFRNVLLSYSKKCLVKNLCQRFSKEKISTLQLMPRRLILTSWKWYVPL